jgi:tetratricopeptide (TPR) repeat protein
MHRLKILLFLPLLVCVHSASAQKSTPADDGSLHTLGEEPEPGPRRVSRTENLLLHGDFDKLESIATRLRTEKTRAPGGAWVLHTFYDLLNPKENDEHLLAVRRQHLEEWMKAKPESITARVALANFYTSYAWVARGGAESDKVPDSAWPLFTERAKKAEGILHDALKLDQKCPEWYAALQIVALAEDWEKDRAKKLFEQAIRFEPDYPYYYERYANYLLPKWDGSEKESLDFIKKTADQRGGDAGDILYFQIATVMISRSNGKFHPELDWPRLQRGHAALETAFGAAPGEENHFALMAFRFKDAAVAKKEFEAIGDKWARTVWKTRGAFEKARDWATANGPG